VLSLGGEGGSVTYSAYANAQDRYSKSLHIVEGRVPRQIEPARERQSTRKH